MRTGTTRFTVATFTALLTISAACTDRDPDLPEQEDGAITQAVEAPMLFRAPAISNVIDGVTWEAGNWEPHLAAGEEGVSWGNHRAVVSTDGVSQNADGGVAAGQAAPDAVFVTIPWRRRDADPGNKSVIVVDAATGEAVANAVALRIENSSGDVVFQLNPGSSEYYVYYLPWQSTGGYYPTMTYPTSSELRAAVRSSGGIATATAERVSRAEEAGSSSLTWAGMAPNPAAAWEEQVRSTSLDSLPQARTTHIQSVDAFHSFFPMEVIAAPEEEAAFLATALGMGPEEGGSGDGGWALIPEHRDYPIRMRHFLPRHWIDRAEVGAFTSTVLRDEAFTFQIAVLSGGDSLNDLSVTFDGFPRSWSQSLTCFNCGGVDEKGLPFEKALDVSAETIQPLWIGVMVPEDQRPGVVEGTVTVASDNRESRSVQISLDVQSRVAPNGGANDPELQTRLAWLNSTIGSDPDFIIAPFEPVVVDDPRGETSPSLSILGRSVELSPTGLPSQIYSYFTPELTHFAEEPEPILARPLELAVVTPGGFLEEFESSPFEIRQESRGRAEWTATSSSDYLEMTVDGALEYDGMLDLGITLVATSDAAIDEIELPVSLVPDAAEYMLGLGNKGGKRPPSIEWKWAVENHQEGVWLGGIHKGLQYVLRDENYVRPLNTNFYQNQPLNMPPSWFNDGKGGIQIVEEVGPRAEEEVAEEGTGEGVDPRPIVTAHNYSGPRELLAGDTLHFNIRFLITPLKPIDTGAHFNTRFVHQYVPVDSVRDWGGTVVNIHHANEINPYINYPFFSLDLQKAYIDEAHAKGIKVKLYNTIRELTYKAHELFAMRSLGDEILNDGEGGGHSWMQEHMEADYHSAWHAARTDDAAMLNKGTSRWTNYYVEGINWLAANQEIDGLYLDDIAFSRETVKRLVTVLAQNRPDVVIDLHSANQFNPRDGHTNSAMLYMEHFPFISRLWFGEYFEYDLDEDYWMTEVAGLPFGLMGEMLQDGGHPYRGLLYGMTARKYGDVDPRPVWSMMNDFGIAESRMLGYWLEDKPVTTDHPRVLATTYLRPEGALVALASWSGRDELVKLEVDWEVLGFGPAAVEAVADPELDPESVTALASESTGAPVDAQAGPQAGALATPVSIRTHAPNVEGLQAAQELDLSAVRIPANQGLFILIRPNGG